MTLEDQTPNAQLLYYQGLPQDQIVFYLQNALTHLINLINTVDIKKPILNMPLLAKKIFSLFSSFEMSIVFVDSSNIQKLNHQYRQKNYPTNILSFTSSLPIDFYQNLPKKEQIFSLGDLVVNLPLIEEEAKIQDKLFNHHLIHILIHGLLHLLDFDHVLSDEATLMESLEVQLLQIMEIPNPYDSN